jgi:hypothetical protein
MIGHGKIVCAACLLLATGCVAGSFLDLRVWSPKGSEQVVLGSPERVSFTVQAALSHMGLFVRANREGEDIRISSTSPAGKHFTLVLKRKPSPQGDSTVIRVDWEKEADEAFWLELAGELTREQLGPGNEG